MPSQEEQTAGEHVENWKQILSNCRLCLPAARTISSFTLIAPEITKPRPNPGNMYALFACYSSQKFKLSKNKNKNKKTELGARALGSILNLGGNKHLAIIFHGVKWTSTPKNSTALLTCVI